MANSVITLSLITAFIAAASLWCQRRTNFRPARRSKSRPVVSLTLKAIAAWPIITYHRGFTGRGHIDERFAEAGIKPDIVMAALDADVIKNYVELGLGVGLIASMAFVPDRDTELQLLDCSHLFDERTSMIAVRRGRYLRDYVYRFIELSAPHLVMDKFALKPPRPIIPSTG